MRARGWMGVALVAALAVATGVEGQTRRGPRRQPREDPRNERRADAPRVWLSAALFGAEPQGEFGERVDAGGGGQLAVALPVTGNGAVRVRGELGFLVYGHEHRELCWGGAVGCRIGLGLDTDNTILFAGVGPELAWPGRLSPYANGTLGFSYFSTFSSLSGSGFDQEAFARTDHFDDFVPAARAGGGVRVGVTRGRLPVALDLGAQYHWNGVADYLVEGDIVDEPDGSLTLYPNRTEANLVTVHFGVTVGIPGRRGR